MKAFSLALALTALSAWACSPPRNTPGERPIQRNDILASDVKRNPIDGLEGRASTKRVVVYVSEREQLHTYALDARTGGLSLQSSVSLPDPVHYAAADRAARFLYVSVSDGTSRHGLHAFGIDAETGTLAEHEPPLVPPLGRIIHLSVDPAGRYLVLAHNRAAQLSSVRVDADGSLAGFVEQAAPAHTGFFTHQALLDGAGTGLVACGLGADAADAAPEQPGSLTVFRYADGQLTRQQTLLPGPRLGPRHLDYRGDRVFVAMERGNRLSVYRYRGGVLEERPEFDVSTLKDPANTRQGQRAGAIQVHPDGKFLYLSNRATRSGPLTLAGQPAEVFSGGENNIALFELEANTGEPHLIDHYDTHGFEPRTFTIEPSGRFLIVANQSQRNVLDASGSIRPVPRSVVVFAIGEGGRLTHASEYEFTRGELFWVGSLELPG